MAKIFITCPSCHRELSFDEVKGWQNMIVECPACHFKANASVYQSGSSSQGGQGSDDDPTVGPAGDECTDTGCLRVEGTNTKYLLKEGTNIVGREAMSGKADIRIPGDPYMSRSHVRIDVVKGHNGLEHRLVEINSKNIVQLNGKPISRGDILLLSFGDKLRLGHTDFVFDEADADGTLFEED